MPDTTPEIVRTDEDYMHLSGVQCLPDFTENIANVVGHAYTIATKLETFIGDRVERIASSARQIGTGVLYVIHEGRDDYPE